MKMSEWLRQWQLTGAVPDEGGTEIAFWGGWLVSHAESSSNIQVSDFKERRDTAREMAIRAAEFIEGRVK